MRNVSVAESIPRFRRRLDVEAPIMNDPAEHIA
jgi:hypothetical protein